MKSVIAVTAFATLLGLGTISSAEAAGVGIAPVPAVQPAAQVEKAHWGHRRHHRRYYSYGWAYPSYYGYYYAPRRHYYRPYYYGGWGGWGHHHRRYRW